MPPTFPIASLNRYTPNFSGVPQKLTWCQQFGLQIFPKWGDAHICPPKNAVFRCFFGQNKFSRPNRPLCHSLSYIFWQLLFQPIIWAIKKEVLSILRSVWFLLTHWEAYVNSILQCVFKTANKHYTSHTQNLHFAQLLVRSVLYLFNIWFIQTVAQFNSRKNSM